MGITVHCCPRECSRLRDLVHGGVKREAEEIDTRFVGLRCIQKLDSYWRGIANLDDEPQILRMAVACSLAIAITGRDSCQTRAVPNLGSAVLRMRESHCTIRIALARTF